MLYENSVLESSTYDITQFGWIWHGLSVNNYVAAGYPTLNTGKQGDSIIYRRPGYEGYTESFGDSKKWLDYGVIYGESRYIYNVPLGTRSWLFLINDRVFTVKLNVEVVHALGPVSVPVRVSPVTVYTDEASVPVYETSVSLNTILYGQVWYGEPARYWILPAQQADKSFLYVTDVSSDGSKALVAVIVAPLVFTTPSASFPGLSIWAQPYRKPYKIYEVSVAYNQETDSVDCAALEVVPASTPVGSAVELWGAMYDENDERVLVTVTRYDDPSRSSQESVTDNVDRSLCHVNNTTEYQYYGDWTVTRTYSLSGTFYKEVVSVVGVNGTLPGDVASHAVVNHEEVLVCSGDYVSPPGEACDDEGAYYNQIEVLSNTYDATWLLVATVNGETLYTHTYSSHSESSGTYQPSCWTGGFYIPAGTPYWFGSYFYQLVHAVADVDDLRYTTIDIRRLSNKCYAVISTLFGRNHSVEHYLVGFCTKDGVQRVSRQQIAFPYYLFGTVNYETGDMLYSTTQRVCFV